MADGSAKLSGRDYEFPEPTLRRKSTVKGERISAENLTAIGKSFDLKNKKMTQKLGKNFGLFKEDFIFVIILNRGFNLRAKKRIILYFQDLYYWTKLLWEEIYDAVGGLEKSQHIWGKHKFNCIDIAGKDGILYSIITLRKNSFRWKDPEEALHLIPFECESKHTLSRLAAQRTCGTKFFK